MSQVINSMILDELNNPITQGNPSTIGQLIMDEQNNPITLGNPSDITQIMMDEQNNLIDHADHCVTLDTTGAEVLISHPGTYIQEHSYTDFRILDIKAEPITTWEQWSKVTSPDMPDDHIDNFVVQFSFALAPRNNNYLMVTDEGKVTVAGNNCDPRTMFKVICDIINNHFQIICQGGKCKGFILYMDGRSLKTKPSQSLIMSGNGNTNPDTLFRFQDVGNCKEIISLSKEIALDFNSHGDYTVPGYNNGSRHLPLFNANVNDNQNLHKNASFQVSCPISMKVKVTRV